MPQVKMMIIVRLLCGVIEEIEKVRSQQQVLLKRVSPISYRNSVHPSACLSRPGTLIQAHVR